MNKVKYPELVLAFGNVVGWQDFVESEDEIKNFIEKLEERTGLSFMAKFEGDTVNGFVTGPYKIDKKLGFIVSVYCLNQEISNTFSSAFEAVIVNNELEELIYG